MRWFCVSPTLQPGSQLRIRAEPDAASPETSDQRLCILDVVTVEKPPVKSSWYEAKWNASRGFIMSELTYPGFEGMKLLVPWESTPLLKIIYLYPETELVHETTRDVIVLESDSYVGVVATAVEEVNTEDDEENEIRELYIVKYLGESYRVDKSEVCIMAERIPENITFMLNPTLPPQATVAIRPWPNKEFEQIDVLVHGQSIRAELRSGVWIKIHDHGWAMWNDEAMKLELLKPSNVVQRYAESTQETAKYTPIDNKINDNLQELGPLALETPLEDVDDDRSPRDGYDPVVPYSEHLPAEQHSLQTTSPSKFTPDLIDSTLLKESTAAPATEPNQMDEERSKDRLIDDKFEGQRANLVDERPIHPSKTLQESTDEETSPNDKVIEPYVTSDALNGNLAEERPIHPAKTLEESPYESIPVENTSDDVATDVPMPSPPAPNKENNVEKSTFAATEVASNLFENERPIRPAPDNALHAFEPSPSSHRPNSIEDERPIRPASDDTLHAYEPTSSSQNTLEELVTELQDVNIMWSLQLELLESLKPYTTKTLSTDDLEKIQSMLGVKMCGTLHPKVAPVFLDIAFTFLKQLKPQAAPLTLHIGLLRLFQVKISLERLEPFLPSWIEKVPREEAWQSLETIVLSETPLSEIGMARLLTWWARHMTSLSPQNGNRGDLCSLKLCDGLIPFTTHRASKVREAAIEILAFVLSHQENHGATWLELVTDENVQQAVRDRMEQGGSGVSSVTKSSNLGSTSPKTKALERINQWKEQVATTASKEEENNPGVVVPFKEWKEEIVVNGSKDSKAEPKAKEKPLRLPVRSRFALLKQQQAMQITVESSEEPPAQQILVSSQETENASPKSPQDEPSEAVSIADKEVVSIPLAVTEEIKSQMDDSKAQTVVELSEINSSPVKPWMKPTKSPGKSKFAQWRQQQISQPTLDDADPVKSSSEAFNEVSNAYTPEDPIEQPSASIIDELITSEEAPSPTTTSEEESITAETAVVPLDDEQNLQVDEIGAGPVPQDANSPSEVEHITELAPFTQDSAPPRSSFDESSLQTLQVNDERLSPPQEETPQNDSTAESSSMQPVISISVATNDLEPPIDESLMEFRDSDVWIMDAENASVDEVDYLEDTFEMEINIEEYDPSHDNVTKTLTFDDDDDSNSEPVEEANISLTTAEELSPRTIFRSTICEEMDEIFPESKSIDGLYVPDSIVTKQLEVLKQMYPGEMFYRQVAMLEDAALILAATFTEAYDFLLDDEPELDEIVLTPKDLHAIETYKAQWKQAKESVLMELRPRTAVPHLTQSALVKPRLLEAKELFPQSPLTTTARARASSTLQPPSTPSLLRKPISNLTTPTTTRLARSASSITPPTTPPVSTTTTPARQSGMRLPSTRTPLSGLRQPSNRSLLPRKETS
ncbi:unnamed protein product [Aphanomyces euteiches]|nr:hypothetical protein AeRB84_002449 [Aphanomyces euteiches]